MPLKPCRTCGNPCSNTASSCPKCGNEKLKDEKIVKCRSCGKKCSLSLYSCPECGDKEFSHDFMENYFLFSLGAVAFSLAGAFISYVWMIFFLPKKLHHDTNQFSVWWNQFFWICFLVSLILISIAFIHEKFYRYYDKDD